MSDQFLSAGELGSCLSEIEIIAIQHLPRASPYLITGVSQSQLSVARHYGGCQYQGQEYVYVQTTDELVRADVARLVSRLRTAAAKRARTEARERGDQAQGDLL